MLKIAIICFSMTGEITASEIKQILSGLGHEVTLAKKSRHLPDSITIPLKEWTKEMFEQMDAIIFVGACGIAVRTIAPFICKKTLDPAILVIDECKKHIISLLSGHIGGANELTTILANKTGADPVITTATDLHEQFAVDVFAGKQNCAIKNMTAAKFVSADLLAGKQIGIYSEFKMDGVLPKQLIVTDQNGISANGTKFDLGIAVTIHKQCLPFANTVQLIPKALSLGVGCKKATPADAISAEINRRILNEKYYIDAFVNLASIDLKKEEEGLLKFAEEQNLPFVTYTSEELQAIEGDFTESTFVKSITGVSNVCERSAVKASQKGTLIEKKTGLNGVTTAVACADWRIHFE
ncbi:MAG: cobalamin biosynthesis protein [Eubacteriales bacterium]|nr:cobalamin biosynthesis protein [Eubacteriales bacterium]